MDGIVVTSYDIDWRVDPREGTLEGTAAVSVRNNGNGSISILPLTLNRLLEVYRIQDGNGRFLPVRQRIALDETVTWFPYQINLVEVPLNEPLIPGSTITLILHYGGHLAPGLEAMRYVPDRICEEFTMLRDETRVYPLVHGANLRRHLETYQFAYRLSITVPRGFVAANGGLDEGIEESGGWVTYRYSIPEPRWRIDVTIGRFKVIGSRKSGAVGYGLAESYEELEKFIGVAIETLELYRVWWGPLRHYSYLAVLQTPTGYGGQSDTPFIIQTTDHASDPYHELAHFYNPARQRNGSRWMSEGFASFVQELVRVKRGDAKEPLPKLLEKNRIWLLRAADKDPLMAALPLDEYYRLKDTIPQYALGALFFYQFYQTVGDELFHRAAAALYREHGESVCDAQEWRQTVESTLGRSIGPLFEEWVVTNRCWERLRQGSVE